jgi:Flp pilus assembly pilin Flp
VLKLRKPQAGCETVPLSTVRSIRDVFSLVRRGFVRDERGGAMVEFALVASLVFIPIVFGIIEFGRSVWAKNMVTTAAREGVRYAIVHGSGSGDPFDSAAVAGYVEGRTAISPIVVRTISTGLEPQDTVTVTVSYVYNRLMPIPGIPSTKTITGKSAQIISW